MPSSAVVYWQHNPKYAFGGVIFEPRDIRVMNVGCYFGHEKAPRILPPMWANQKMVLIGDVITKERDAYPAPIMPWIKLPFLPVLLAREYFRREMVDLSIPLGFVDKNVALGCALASGHAACFSSAVPSAHFIGMARRWGAQIRIRDFCC